MSTIADPLSRCLVWLALWNATRDALLPAELYLNAVVRHAGGERDISLLQTLANNAIHALSAYCPAETRAEAREHLIAGFRAHLTQAVPASDEQLVWAQALAVVGRGSDTQVAGSRALLAGDDVPEGLSVDGDLRWLLWQQLAARGQTTVAELDAELAANTTAEFRANHFTAVAAIPEAEGKAQAWHAAVAETKLSNQLLSATISGFMMAGAELLEPYIEPYFEVIEKIWAERSLGIAGRIVQELFPAHQDLLPGTLPEQQPVLVRTDRWLAEHATAANGLRRIILEQRDQLLRSLRAQALQR
ncbi:ERAP1-like C-terminal domain-containing protein [Arthrobacter psychrolactophilus]